MSTQQGKSDESADIVINGNGKRRVRMSVSVMFGLLALLGTAVSFAANYLFATKTEIAASREFILSKHTDGIQRFEALAGDVKTIRVEMLNMKKSQDDMAEVQREMDKNLRRLLERRRGR